MTRQRHARSCISAQTVDCEPCVASAGARSATRMRWRLEGELSQRAGRLAQRDASQLLSFYYMGSMPLSTTITVAPASSDAGRSSASASPCCTAAGGSARARSAAQSSALASHGADRPGLRHNARPSESYHYHFGRAQLGRGVPRSTRRAISPCMPVSADSTPWRRGRAAGRPRCTGR